jgi:hypothetical protein
MVTPRLDLGAPPAQKLTRRRDNDLFAMDAAAVARREGEGSTASEMCWASDDITVLNALLETPAPHDRSQRWTGTGAPALGERREHPRIPVGQRGLGEDKDEADESIEDAADQVVVTSLRRQVHLLQQAYDRQLEQRVAKSVIAAGGRSAPRASTIRLYRQYERLRRVAASLTAENQQLAVLLETQKKLQSQPSPQTCLPNDAGAFQDATYPR